MPVTEIFHQFILDCVLREGGGDSMPMPDIFKQFVEDYPELLKVHKQLGALCAEAGPLDEKTKQLVQLGIAVGAQSKGGVRSHARQAKDVGASDKEIFHAVIVSTSSVGFPAMIAAYGWVRSMLGE
jgi:4-carboxymuconolactone decarboxylase